MNTSNLQNIGGVLSRNEMKSIMAGALCSTSVACPNGMTLGCSSSSGHCHSGGGGSGSWINCGVGEVVAGCWMHNP